MLRMPLMTFAATALLAGSLLAAERAPIRVERLPLGGTAAVRTLADARTAPDAASVAKRLRAQLAGGRMASGRSSLSVGPNTEPRIAAPALGPRIGSTVGVIYRTNGTPLQIRGDALQRPDNPHTSLGTDSLRSGTRDDLATARAFLRSNAALLHIANPDRELVAEEQSIDELGRAHVRFEQQFQGVTVWPAEVIVHLDRAGNVDLMDGNYIPTPRRITTRAIVGAADAIAKARGTCLRSLASGELAAAGVPQLIVYAHGTRRPRLAWKLDVSESLAERWTIVVDAVNGAVLTRFNRVETANVTGSGRDLGGVTRSLNLWLQGGTYFLLDSSKMMFDPTSTTPNPQSTRGAIFVADATNLPATNNPQSFPPSLAIVRSASATGWPVPDTVSASYLLSQTYDYYLERHHRNSIDGNGGTVTAIVRLGRSFPNAFWDNEQQFMVFGDKDLYAGSVDVIAHEMTHGVTDHSARLVYQDQSGALNEAISDIFGEMVEARTNGTNDWIIGSGLRTPIRNMKDPGLFNDPAKMSDYVHTSEDNGGVHTNSGIINRAFYLLAEGLPGAIGRRDAEQIFYRALTQHLTKDAHFVDARVAAMTSADELFGAGSNQSKKVAEAFDAVEVFGTVAVPDPPSIPAVSGSDATLFVYRSASKNTSFLGRREIGSDGSGGATLSRFDVTATRPSVTADGSMAVFVDSIHDVCLIETDGATPEQCLDLPGVGLRVSSVGMSADGSKFGFVLLGNDNVPENRIIVVDVGTDTQREYSLATPVYDGASFGSVAYADAMTFTADNEFLVFDAFNELQTNGQPWGAWSIYALGLKSGATFNVIPPTDGLDIGWPQLGHTSNDLLTFETFDVVTGISRVISANLDTADAYVVAQESGVDAAPSYTGDDRAIVYAVPAPNESGASLAIVPVAADHITPAGAPSLWLVNAAFPTVYRRGAYAGPTTQPGSLAFASSSITGVEGSAVTVTVLRIGGNKGAVAASYATLSGSALSGADFVSSAGTLTWSDGEMGAKTFQVRLLADTVTEGTETLTVSLTAPAGGASLGVPSNATLSIKEASAPSAPPKRRRSAPH
ncbi:MAG: Thermolysin [Acidobacteria bacterium]|nr:Thermolysin [Acidobacteriota bacterium]